eukprot:gene17115-20524_t
MITNVSSLASVPANPSPASVSDSSKTEDSGTLSLNPDTGAKSAPAAGGGQAASTSQESDTVKALKKQIAELQKQLQEQQQNMQKAQASNQSADAKAAAVAAAQAQIAATAAALQSASSALLQALTSDGGSGTGSIVKAFVYPRAILFDLDNTLTHRALISLTLHTKRQRNCVYEIQLDRTCLTALCLHERPHPGTTGRTTLMGIPSYPEEARLQGLTGLVRVEFVVDAKGNLIRHKVISHTGSDLFVSAVERFVPAASPVPAPPPSMLLKGEIQVVAPFVFCLEGVACGGSPPRRL